ncbi:LTA synthase family protein [Gilvimarinus sp. F26214L]|uniref:LTA synthase family protein n=1 Tax=Gilvimarinus sp. DZF01 TaxID=3461371 RepID=UPI00404665A2
MIWLQSRRLRYLAGSAALFFLLFAFLRAIFVWGFADVDSSQFGVADHFWSTFLVGLRFDLRLAILATLPLVLLAYLPFVNLVRHGWMRLLARGYLLAAVLALVLLYFLDFGHYDYLGVRLNATVFRFAGNADISTSMLWQSYPVVWITLGWLALSGLMFAAFLFLERRSLGATAVQIPRKQVVFAATAVTILVFFGLLGRLSVNLSNPVPLRWSDAFFSGNAELAAIGLNPVIFLFDTAGMETSPYDRDVVAEHYEVVADYLGVSEPNREELNFTRRHGAQSHSMVQPGQRPPNVVFVMLESLGASRVGAYGNPLDTTPNLDRLAREGWFFERFFVPVSGTAKTVWASITGIPDVTREETASRNPLISRQHTVMNAFRDHSKHYLIGGSAGWANISAVITNSIDGIELREEGDWKGPNVDVWGISDLQLFREADEILRELPKDKPFFAYIQTAGNHRPFTIPEDRGDFEEHFPSEDEVEKWGFRSLAQYNAVRFLDYNIGEFMKMAKASGYHDNTIFVFFGDHNNRITQLPHMPPIYDQMWLESNHVPHIIYAPNLLQPRVVEEATSLVDMLPTVAGVMGLEYENHGMGRDFQLHKPGRDRAVPVVLLEGSYPIVGMVSKSFLLKMNYDGSEPSLHAMDSAEPSEDVSAQHPETFEYLRNLTRGTYETSRYMLYGNVRGE